MFLHVVSAEHIEGHRIRLSFNDGTAAELNLSDELNGIIFDPLKDIDYFKKFKLIGHTLAWDNGADFAPEFLKDLAKEQGTLLSEAS